MAKRTKAPKRNWLAERNQFEEENVRLQDRLATVNRLVEKAEKVAAENKQLLQHRAELTLAVQNFGRVFSVFGDALAQVGATLAHSVPVIPTGTRTTIRHYEDGTEK